MTPTAGDLLPIIRRQYGQVRYVHPAVQIGVAVQRHRNLRGKLLAKPRPVLLHLPMGRVRAERRGRRQLGR